MNLEELKAQHPKLYAAVLALGVQQERDRVVSHLDMGDAAKDVDAALRAIRDGDEMTAGHVANYSAAAMRRRDLTLAIEDDATTADATAGVRQGQQDADFGDQVVAALRADTVEVAQ